jgi:hypothetical protein
MGGRRGCCCGRDCWSTEDDFNRENSDDPGSRWDEVSGDWDILNNYLTGVSEGILITTERQPSPVRSGAKYTLRITVDLIDFPESGTKDWKVICGFEDEDNFDWVWLAYDASTEEITPKLMRRSGGSDSVMLDPADYDYSLFPVDAGTGSISITICYADVHWSVSDNDYVYEICGGGKETLPANGDHGLVGFLAGDFDNFYYEEHWESNTDCPYCDCFCLNPNDEDDYACFPSQLTLTITGSCLDGTTLTMYQGSWSDGGIGNGDDPDYLDWPNKSFWVSDTFHPASEEWPDDNEEEPGEKLFFELRCSIEYGYVLYIWGVTRDYSEYYIPNSLYFENEEDENNRQRASLGLSTCDPISMVFENLISPLDNCCLDPGCSTMGEKMAVCPDQCEETGSLSDFSFTITITE